MSHGKYCLQVGLAHSTKPQARLPGPMASEFTLMVPGKYLSHLGIRQSGPIDLTSSESLVVSHCGVEEPGGALRPPNSPGKRQGFFLLSYTEPCVDLQVFLTEV